MAITRCEICERFIDLDYSPEVYREELDMHGVCDNCMERYDLDELAELLDL